MTHIDGIRKDADGFRFGPAGDFTGGFENSTNAFLGIAPCKIHGISIGRQTGRPLVPRGINQTGNRTKFGPLALPIHIALEQIAEVFAQATV